MVYKPEIGGFISSDGLLGPVGNILGHNRYSYTQNNPVMYVDLSGCVIISIGMALAVKVQLLGSGLNDWECRGLEQFGMVFSYFEDFR